MYLPVEFRCASPEPAGEVGQRARPQVVAVHGAAEGGGRAAPARGGRAGRRRGEHVRHEGVVPQQLLDGDGLAPRQRERRPTHHSYILHLHAISERDFS